MSYYVAVDLFESSVGWIRAEFFKPWSISEWIIFPYRKCSCPTEKFYVFSLFTAPTIKSFIDFMTLSCLHLAEAVCVGHLVRDTFEEWDTSDTSNL
jgi:hypothetical protein